MIGISRLCLGICFIASEITAFQWSSASLEDNTHVYVCPGNDATLPWSFNKSDAENVIDVQWFVQKDNSTPEVLASLVAGHFFTDNDNVQHVPPAGLHINHISVNDSGNYSVIVNVQHSTGFSKYTHSAVLSAVEPPVMADGHPEIQLRPGALRDERTGVWFVQLECGRFVSLGQPPVTVLWTTPSGQTTNSSSFHNGTFVLNLPSPVESGHYSCAVDNDTTTAECLDDRLLKSAQTRLNDVNVRLQIVEAEKERLTHQVDQLETENRDLRHNVTQLTSKLHQCNTPAHDCMDVQLYSNQSGVTTIFLPDDTPLDVYCDQNTDKGGWTVFQRRMDGSVDFYRNWTDYQTGFGDLTGEFWLGLENLHSLTSNRTYELRVDLAKWDGTEGYATYSNFSISDSSDKYRLHFNSFTGGTAGDSLHDHNNMQFATRDAVNVDCAQRYHGAWWYEHCHDANLNGDYKPNSNAPAADGLNWDSFAGESYSMKVTEMKIRPM